MEEKNKLQQNNSGNTPPPVPQPAPPPPFVAPDGGDETCGQNVQKSQEESTPQEEAHGSLFRSERGESAYPYHLQHAYGEL